MTENLVDVLDGNGTVLHTFPVTVGASISSPTEKDFEEKALSAAAHAQLVPTPDLESLSARIHVGRGGTLTAYGDARDVMSETKIGLDQIVREQAYQIWEQEGRPEGQADRHWNWTCGFEEA